MAPRKTRKLARCDFQVAIPSYMRAETCRDKTLAVLAQYKIPASCIKVFVANEEQKKIYQDTLKPGTYGTIVVGIKGLAEVRNFITKYYPKGTHLVCIDDDVRGFLEYDANAKRHERPLRSLKAIIERGFKECQKAGAHFWGVYSVPNGFFMKPTVTTDLKFCIGSFWGCINTQDVLLKHSEKEDYERTLRFWDRDGVVIRLNFVAPKTAYYKEPGGMMEENRKQKQEIAVQYLLKTWPQYVVRNPTRKSGYPEIRIKQTKEHT